MLTLDTLSALYAPTLAHTCEPFVGPLSAALYKYGIATLNQQCAFLATIGVESARLTTLSENLNYGAAGLHSTWPSHFDPATAAAYARQPERIANRAYANRMGNGDEASGDGWLYRGAGLIQLTGKDNHAAYAAACGKPVTMVGDWLRTPEGAADGAGWFWSTHHLNAISAGGDMAAVTRMVNGGENGLADRVALFSRAKTLLFA
jgi:putative chitinase